MSICAWWSGAIPINKKGIILCGLQTYNIFANQVLANISYVPKPCNPCQFACEHFIVCKPGGCEHIICLWASLGTHLGTNAKACLGKHPICNSLCRCIVTSEWCKDTYLLFQCWLEKGGAYHSSLHFSWAWGLAIFDGKCVSLISAEYHLFFSQSTLTITLADHCRHP